VKEMKRMILWLLVIAITLSVITALSTTGCKGKVAEETTAAETTVAETTAAETTVAETTAAEEKVKVTVFGWLTTYAKPFSEKFKQFVEAKYPNIELEFVEYVYEETGTQYLLMAESGDVPDVAYVEEIMTYELADIGALEDMRDWISEDVINDLSPGAKELGTIGGKLYSVYWDISPYALFTNRILAEKAGFTKPPRTFEEYEEMVYAIAALGKDEKGNKIWGTNIAGLDDVHPPFLIAPWLFNFGGDYFDENKKCIINSPEAVKLFTWFKKMYDDGVFGPIPIDRETNRTLFMEGDLGFIGEGPWQRGIWRESSGQGEEFDKTWWVDTYPTEDGSPGTSIAHGSGATIMKGAKHPEEAAKVIEMWASDPDVVLAYNELNGGIPAVQSIQSLPQIQNDAYIKAFIDGLTPKAKFPFIEYAPKVMELAVPVAIAFHDILLNDAPIQERLDSLAEELDKIAVAE
jgi:multiple sugar transport system substrate-binding protein